MSTVIAQDLGDEGIEKGGGKRIFHSADFALSRGAMAAPWQSLASVILGNLYTLSNINFPLLTFRDMNVES